MKTTILFPASPGALTTVEPEGDGVRIVNIGPNGTGVETRLSRIDALTHAAAILRALGATP